MLDLDEGSRTIPRPIVPFKTYRIRSAIFQLPYVAMAIQDFFGRVVEPLGEITMFADGSVPSYRMFEFPVDIPVAPNTDEFVLEVSPYIDGVWYWDDLGQRQNLRCPEHLWREHPTGRQNTVRSQELLGAAEILKRLTGQVHFGSRNSQPPSPTR